MLAVDKRKKREKESSKRKEKRKLKWNGLKRNGKKNETKLLTKANFLELKKNCHNK